MSTQEQVSIRRATPHDAAALGRYGGALMRQHHGFDPKRFIEVDDPEAGYGAFLVAQLDAPSSVVLVAARDGKVVGYAYGSIEPASWKELRAACGFVHDVYIDPAVRLSGVGERLVYAAIEALEQMGARQTILWSAAKNVDAQRLFARLGFRTTMVEMTRHRE